jgi:hypothetical protein
MTGVMVLDLENDGAGKCAPKNPIQSMGAP